MSVEEKEAYRGALNKGTLSYESLNQLLAFFDDMKLCLESVPKELLKELGVSSLLNRLELRVCYGNRSWEGLVIGFPGDRKELSTKYVGTPYLRVILYPILDLYVKLRQQSTRPLPCLYLLGERFNDVFLRKFRFFKSLIPSVIVLTNDLYQCATRDPRAKHTSKKPKINEQYCNESLRTQMKPDSGLVIPIGQTNTMKLGLISHEVPTVAGTVEPEQLDILGYDINDHSLVAFELKGPGADKEQLENLFLQGMEHRDWLEENKKSVKFAFDGTVCVRINPRKRVKLVLGFCGGEVPLLFHDLKAQALKRDRHLQIEFCRLIPPDTLGKKVKVGSFYR